MMRRFVVAAALLTLGACATPQKYPAVPETSAALKKTLPGNINVGAISAPKDFNAICRIQGAISPPDYRMSFEGYLQNALIEEIKAAERFDDKAAKVTLSGDLEKLYFSTTEGSRMSRGFWDIGLRVKSSNGKSVSVSEHYEFDSGFLAATACRNASAAYLPAVQALIGKLVRSPDFKSLVAQ